MDYSQFVELPDYKNMTYKIKKKDDKATRCASVLSQVINKSKMKKYPQKQIDHEKYLTKEEDRMVGRRFHMSYNEVKKAIMDESGITEKQFNESMQATAEDIAKTQLVTYAIAQKEHIRINKADYEEYKNNTLKNEHLTRKKFKKYYKVDYDKYADLDDLKSYCLQIKVANKLYDYATENVSQWSSLITGILTA